MNYYNLNIFDLFNLFRAHNQLKNLIIFVPIYFNGSFFLISTDFFNSIKLFFLFLFSTSLAYLINDYFDYENDKKNPKKSNKVVFRKEISKSFLFKSIIILFFFFILFLYSVELNYFSKILSFAYLLIIYIYSIYLKRVPFIEMMIIPLGYNIRLFAADLLIFENTKIIIYVIVYSTVFFTILLKRYSEYSFNEKYRNVLRFYNNITFITLIFISYFIIIICHILYTLDINIYSKHGNLGLLSNIPVIVLLSACIYDCFKVKNFEDPILYFLKSKRNIILVLTYFTLYFFSVYLGFRL